MYNIYKYRTSGFAKVGRSGIYAFVLQPRVVERHFLDLGKRYGSVIAVDLVNKVFFFFKQYHLLTAVFVLFRFFYRNLHLTSI